MRPREKIKLFASDKWETISEIAERTHQKYRVVSDGIKDEFKTGQTACRLLDDPDGYGQLLEFRKK